VSRAQIYDPTYFEDVTDEYGRSYEIYITALNGDSIYSDWKLPTEQGANTWLRDTMVIALQWQSGRKFKLDIGGGWILEGGVSANARDLCELSDGLLAQTVSRLLSAAPYDVPGATRLAWELYDRENDRRYDFSLYPKQRK
jgi:hypothetical protein